MSKELKKKSSRGRPPKEVEERLLEGLSKLSPLFLEKLEEALHRGDAWALKIYAQTAIPKDAGITIQTNNYKDAIPQITFQQSKRVFKNTDIIDITDESITETKS